MQVRARLKNFRMSSKKARLWADLIRGKEVSFAKSQLQNARAKMAEPLLKLLESSVANGVHNFGLDKENLFIEQIKIDEGMVLKRWMPRAHGRAFPIMKRSCHVEIILNEIEEGKGRTEVKKKEAQTLSYKELKKITSEADKIIESQEKGKKKERQKEQKEEEKKMKAGKATKTISKIFRRKSI